MSDEKREKLREYLRNNRPKNSVNLGNKSDSKEISNKNLENDLSLDNLNLDNDLNLNNPKILDNKINSNKRDYDKEPLIIYEYSTAINLCFGIIVLIVSIFLFLFGMLQKSSTMILFMVFLVWLKETYDMYKIKQNSNYHFLKTKIVHIDKNNNVIGEILLNEIKSIKKIFWNVSYDDRTLNKTYVKVVLSIFFIFSLIALVYFIDTGADITKFLTVVLLLFIFYFSFPFFIHYVNGGLKSIRMFDTLEIVDNDTKFFIFIKSYYEYDELKKYFLICFGKNLDKFKKSSGIFKEIK